MSPFIFPLTLKTWVTSGLWAQIDAGLASWAADVVVTTTVVVVVVASIDLRECSDLWTRVRDGPVRGGPEGGCSLVSEEVVLQFLLRDMCPMLRRSRQTRATLRSAPPSTAIEQGGPESGCFSCQRDVSEEVVL